MGVSDQGDEMVDGASPEKDTSQEVEINLDGGGKGGGGILNDGGVYQAAVEHGCTLHCYAINARPM